MDYFLRPMSPADAHAVVRWRYPDDNAFYNMEADPEDLREFLDFEKWEPDTKFAVTDGSGDLVGFFEFVTRDGVTEIGLGLRPDVAGHAFGREFLRVGLRFSAAVYTGRGHIQPTGYPSVRADGVRRNPKICAKNQRRPIRVCRNGCGPDEPKHVTRTGSHVATISNRCRGVADIRTRIFVKTEQSAVIKVTRLLLMVEALCNATEYSTIGSRRSFP